MATQIAIIEPNASGHRLWFVRLLIEAAFGEFVDPQVHLFSCAEAVTTKEWATNIGQFAGGIEVHPIDVGPFWRRRLIRQVGRMPDLDLVVIPEGDRWALAIGDPSARLPAALRVLILRPHSQPGTAGRMKALFKHVSWSLASSRQEVSIAGLALTNSNEGTSSWTSAPDPVALAWSGTRAEARRALGLREEERVSLIIGGLSERKGLVEVLAAWSAVDHRDSRLVLVGHVQDPALATRISGLARRDHRVRYVPGHVSDLAFDRWVAGSDRVLALYRNVGSSGVALKAWALGTAVVVWRGSFLDEALPRLGASTVSAIPGELHHVLAAPRGGPDSSVPSGKELAGRNLRFTRSLLGGSDTV